MPELYSVLKTVFAAGAGFIFLNERLTLFETAGALLILVLQIMNGMTPSSTVYSGVDVNNDDKFGLQEVIYILTLQQ